MSSVNQAQSTGLGLFQSFFQAPQFNDFANAAQHAPDQMMRGMARCQLEMQSLVVRRAQAYLELPTRVSQCRTPQDLMAEQQRFMQTYFNHYSESAQHVMRAWSQMFQLTQESSEAERQKGERDFLSFPEPRSLNGVGGESQHQYSSANRKVA